MCCCILLRGKHSSNEGSTSSLHKFSAQVLCAVAWGPAAAACAPCCCPVLYAGGNFGAVCTLYAGGTAVVLDDAQPQRKGCVAKAQVQCTMLRVAHHRAGNTFVTTPSPSKHLLQSLNPSSNMLCMPSLSGGKRVLMPLHK
jgi:hypothetical protein